MNLRLHLKTANIILTILCFAIPASSAPLSVDELVQGVNFAREDIRTAEIQ